MPERNGIEKTIVFRLYVMSLEVAKEMSYVVIFSQFS